MMNVQTLKGFRDFLPREARKRQYVINSLKEVFESYGFEPLETPALEYEEILTGKYGEEGDKLMYRFRDHGGRKIALRYDQTIPTARVVSYYLNELPLPFKRYQFQPVWRAENTQKGRYREFLQCDADIIGNDSTLADAEILGMVHDSYTKLGLDILIKVNDRAILKKIPLNALPVVDKLNKIGDVGVVKELVQKGFSYEDANNLLKQAKSFKASLYLRQVLDIYEKRYPQDSWQFESTLVRGLDYYTGLIFEVVPKLTPQSASLCGGGRYDNLIGIFANKQIPAVGFAIGFDRTFEAMQENNLFPIELSYSITKVLVTIFSPDLLSNSLALVSNLRNNFINAEIYLTEDLTKEVPLDKQLKYADKKGIPFAIIIGPEEVEKNVVTIKNLQTREQKTLSLSDAISLIHNS